MGNRPQQHGPAPVPGLGYRRAELAGGVGRKRGEVCPAPGMENAGVAFNRLQDSWPVLRFPAGSPFAVFAAFRMAPDEYVIFALMTDPVLSPATVMTALLMVPPANA